jgi:hypothetical protein
MFACIAGPAKRPRRRLANNPARNGGV